MKQKAVEWLAIEWNRIDNKWKNVGQGHKHCVSEKAEALKQAKEMEKDQITEAWDKGNLPAPLGRTMTSEDYYKEIFG